MQIFTRIHQLYKVINNIDSYIYKFLSLGLALVAVMQLNGCAAAAVSGAATGVAVACDRRTTGTIVDDQTIELKALQTCLKNKELWKQSHISAISYNNVLVLVGQTPTEDLRRQAIEAAQSIPKVRKIHNELSVEEPVSIGTRTQDTWITTQVKAKMFGKRELNPARIKVITENGIVYLLGLTTEDEEMKATEIARSVSGVTKVVKIFERA